MDQIRKPLRDFVLKMEERLKAKDVKRGEHGWLECHPLWLLARAEEELVELKAELMRPSSAEAVTKEAVDVANFCMMIADTIQTQMKAPKKGA